jgi:hypothetical protein
MVARPGVRTAAAVAIVVAYYLFRFRDSILTFFALDDFWILEAAARVGDGAGAWRLLLPDRGAFVLYRPLTQAGYFHVLRLLFGYDASGYHAVQLAAHVGNALLVLGIVRRLTASHLAALSAALFYAAAPGHIVAIYWLAAYAMTGSTLVVFAAVYLWLRTRGTARIVTCSVLQVAGLLSSEHTVVIPALVVLTSVLGPPRERLALVARQVAIPAALVAAYLAAKLWYLKFSPILGAFPGYAVDGDVARWLAQLARYAAACVNLLTFVHTSDRAWMLTGIAIVGVTLLSVWRVLRGHDRWCLLAAGSTTFVACLLPVLPLREHYFDYYVGSAALGMALVLLGTCRLVTARWTGLAAACVAALLVVDVVTGGAAARSSPVYQLVLGASAGSAGWVRAVRRAAEAGAHEVTVPQNDLTSQVFMTGRCHELFGPPAVRLLFSSAPMAPNTSGAVLFIGRAPPPAPGEPLPGWRPGLAPLRRFAGAP